MNPRRALTRSPGQSTSTVIACQRPSSSIVSTAPASTRRGPAQQRIAGEHGRRQAQPPGRPCWASDPRPTRSPPVSPLHHKALRHQPPPPPPPLPPYTYILPTTSTCSAPPSTSRLIHKATPSRGAPGSKPTSRASPSAISCRPRPWAPLAFLEQQVGVPINLVGVGQGRDQFLPLRRLTRSRPAREGSRRTVHGCRRSGFGGP